MQITEARSTPFLTGVQRCRSTLHCRGRQPGCCCRCLPPVPRRCPPRAFPPVADVVTLGTLVRGTQLGGFLSRSKAGSSLLSEMLIIGSVPTTARGKNLHVLEEKSRSRETVARPACAHEPASYGTESRRPEGRGSSATIQGLEMAAFSQPSPPALDPRALASAEPPGGQSSPATSLGHSSGPRPTRAASPELTGTRSPPPERQGCRTFFFLPSLAPRLHEAPQISRCRAKLLPPREAAVGRREFLATRCGAEVGTLTARPEKLRVTHRRALSPVEEDGDEHWVGRCEPRSLQNARPPSAVGARRAGHRSSGSSHQAGFIPPKAQVMKGSPLHGGANTAPRSSAVLLF